MELIQSNIMQEAINNISKDLNKKLDDYVIEGLKRKGFEFKNRLELGEFIKKRCRCEEKPHIQERIYFVDDIPFFLHNYKSETLDMSSITDKEYTIKANLGSYSYL